MKFVLQICSACTDYYLFHLPQILLYVNLAKYFLLVSLPALGLEIHRRTEAKFALNISRGEHTLCFEKGDSWFSKENLGLSPKYFVLNTFCCTFAVDSNLVEGGHSRERGDALLNLG